MRPPDASCEDVVRLLEAYQDGALAMPERLEFERHVAVCPSCRGYLSQVRMLVAAAGRLVAAGRDPGADPDYGFELRPA